MPSSLAASPVPIVFSMITIGHVQSRLVRLESYSTSAGKYAFTACGAKACMTMRRWLRQIGIGHHKERTGRNYDAAHKYRSDVSPCLEAKRHRAGFADCIIATILIIGNNLILRHIEIAYLIISLAQVFSKTTFFNIPLIHVRRVRCSL
jgi:hypothetical protein